MTDDRVFFFPGTADCQPILVSPFPVPPPNVPAAPNNTMGGYGGLLDLNDYNGSTGNANLFVRPDDVGTSAGIQDQMPNFYALHQASNSSRQSWYLMRSTDFKNWVGVAGIFWRKTSFIMEIDIKPTALAITGGYRDEAPNIASGSTGGPFNATPYTPRASTAQGAGICLKAIITDPVTHLEVVKDSKIFDAPDGDAGGNTGTISFPRQIVQLNLTDITPEEMATMVLRITTEQYSGSSGNSGLDYPNAPLQPIGAQDSTIYRIGLTPDPASLRSSGKQSAALTTR